MNQLVFNLLLQSKTGSIFYKILFILRRALLLINPDSKVIYKYKKFNLEILFSHDYPLNLKTFPLYSENLGVIVSIIREKYPNMYAIDVGANVGDSVAIIHSFCAIPILCIEGNPKFLPILKRNVVQFENVQIEESFVGEMNEKVSLTNHGGSAHLIQNEGNIPVKTFNQIMEERKAFDKAKFIKIDTDGFDLKIIRSAKEILATAHPVLFFEYDPYYLTLQKENPVSVFPLLHELGYKKLFLFDNLGYFLCELRSDDMAIIQDLTKYFDDHGNSYLDICALHSEDEDIVSSIRKAFEEQKN